MECRGVTLQAGARFVSGTADTGQVVLVREDGSAAPVPGVVVVRGVLVDNGDGTFDIVSSEE